ncbi:hypothetical protein MCRO_0459 [Mycoplasma crocodyli MP145]|uniref:Uncharacterized protein n=1 Tax=Mycoplasma crocodyli (strain ATCC 51981 / MP145) TaxID=512564 RepID=D5E5P3_MYCCM|nr:hypothetical protein MCRO_0459 [Mycoplasma crocodyli MP145]
MLFENKTKQKSKTQKTKNKKIFINISYVLMVLIIAAITFGYHIY